jgi:hypothetical protein
MSNDKLWCELTWAFSVKGFINLPRDKQDKKTLQAIVCPCAKWIAINAQQSESGCRKADGSHASSAQLRG